jgi:cytochrome c553
LRRGFLAALLLAACVPATQAADPQAGRTRAQSCSVCHGPLGLSMVPNAPHLAGQPELYLAEQLRNFRSGRRPHEVMSVIARDLSDREIEDLAAWFASLQVQVRER